MKIGIATVQVPFIWGGAEVHANSLCNELRKRGHEAEIISMPFKWYPPECLLDLMLAARLVDVTEVNGRPIERLITLKFPAYYFPHPCKIGWLLHQHRQAYDLYETPYGDLHQTEAGRAVVQEIRRWDRALLPQHQQLFANSRRVAERLHHYNDLSAEPLYHPPGNHEQFYCASYEPFILAPGRLDALKRQQLIIEAMAQVPTPLRLVLIGPTDSDYGEQCQRQIQRLGLTDRVEVRGTVSEAEKLELYAHCLAVYNGVYDEDYGYLTLEAFLAAKPVIVFPDAGGPLEFVRDGDTGLIPVAEPAALADALNRLLGQPGLARELGQAGRAALAAKQISWDYVIERLLA